MRLPRPLLALLVASVVAGAGCGLFKRSLPGGFRQGGLELVYTIEGTGSPSDMLAQQVVYVVTNRIESLALCRPDVTTAGRELKVRLPAACAPGFARIKRLLDGRGFLEIREVDDGRALGDIPSGLAVAAGVEMASEAWRHPVTGETHRALVVTGPAAALDRFRASVPPGVLPAGVEALVAEPPVEGTSARLYLVKREAEVTSAFLTNARLVRDAEGQPNVMVELNLDGTRRFEALTGRLVGRKLAVVLDGRVLTTPNVHQALRTGAALIALPRGDVDRAAEQAEDLVRLFRNGVLPAQLTLHRQSEIPPTR